MQWEIRNLKGSIVGRFLWCGGVAYFLLRYRAIRIKRKFALIELVFIQGTSDVSGTGEIHRCGG